MQRPLAHEPGRGGVPERRSSRRCRARPRSPRVPRRAQRCPPRTRATRSLTGRWRCEVPITSAASASFASASGRTFDGPQPKRPSTGAARREMRAGDAFVIGIGGDRVLAVSLEEAKEPVEGDGYSVASLDGLGEGYGFRKIRRELGVTEFGVNAIVLPAGWETGGHYHERQQELYFVHSGRDRDRVRRRRRARARPRRDGPGRRGDRAHDPQPRPRGRRLRGRRRRERLRRPRRPGARGRGQPRPADPGRRVDGPHRLSDLRDRRAARVRPDHRRGPGGGRRVRDRRGHGARLGDAHHRRRLGQRRRARASRPTRSSGSTSWRRRPGSRPRTTSRASSPRTPATTATIAAERTTATRT